MPEEWRPIKGFEGSYEISSKGRIRSFRRYENGKILSGGKSSGYRSISLKQRPRKPVKRTIHSLVAEAFVGPRPRSMEVLHRDGNKRNNNADNLRYGTPAENAADTALHGVHKGIRNGRSKLTEDDIRLIKRQLAIKPTKNRSAIARAFGVTRTVIGHIEYGRQWTHIS